MDEILLLDQNPTTAFAAALAEYRAAILNGWNVRPLLKKLAAEHLDDWRAAVETHDPAACVLAGECHAQDVLADSDPTEGLKLFRAAAERDLPDAYWLVGECHFDGVGTPRDRKEARRWYAKGAELDFAPAVYSLAVADYEGYGGPKDHRVFRPFFLLREGPPGAGRCRGLPPRIRGSLPRPNTHSSDHSRIAVSTVSSASPFSVRR